MILSGASTEGGLKALGSDGICLVALGDSNFRCREGGLLSGFQGQLSLIFFCFSRMRGIVE